MSKLSDGSKQLLFGGPTDAITELMGLIDKGELHESCLEGLEWTPDLSSWGSVVEANYQQQQYTSEEFDQDLDTQFAALLQLQEFGLTMVQDDDPTAGGSVASSSKHTLDSDHAIKRHKADWRAAMQRFGLTAGGWPAGVAVREWDGREVPAIEESMDLFGPFKDGAVRITRTPGRINDPNSFFLGDVIRKEAVVSALLTSYLIAEPELFPFLPIAGSGPHSRRKAPVFVIRDLGADHMRGIIALQDGAKTLTSKVSKANHDAVSRRVAELYREEFGENLRVCHPWTSGIAHSKIVVVEYERYLLVVITSSNLMSIDLVLGDNAYYIQTFPRLQPGQHHVEHETEHRFFQHLEAMKAPNKFMKRVRGNFDWSSCRVHLWTSEPGAHKGLELHDFGLLRLNSLVRQLVPSRSLGDSLNLEVCCGSIGKLKQGWLEQLMFFLQGGDATSRRFPLPDDAVSSKEGARIASSCKIVYPSAANVNDKDPDVKRAASNIGCSLNGKDWAGWNSAPSWIRDLFHEYVSKDFGRLFHLKQFIWLPKGASSSTPPALIAFGSANSSQAALGSIFRLGKDGNGDAVVRGMGNFECGVAMTGEVWIDMLAEGSKWEDGITYDRNLSRYCPGDKPWNSPAWVKQKSFLSFVV